MLYLQEMKTQPYGNCKVLNMDGELMFRCDLRRASWYLVRKLATVVSPDPYTIQLTFETKGPGHVGDVYYLSEKPNCCAVCGCTDHLTRHHIIPKFYRRNFPDRLKSRSSFDVLPLCVPCHSIYEKHGDELRVELAKEYGVPLAGIGPQKDPVLKRVVQGALCLLAHGDKMRPEQYEKFAGVVRAYLGRDTFTTQDLKACSKIDIRNVHHVDHGAAVMAKVTDHEAFIKRWRVHFLTTMKPNFLPVGWDVDRPIVRPGD